jgi:hypothetical protein
MMGDEVRTITLRGLPGTKRNRKAGFVHSVTAALQALRAKGAATAASDNGALNIWRDDSGAYRCEFMRYRASVDRQIFHRVSDVRRWLKTWLPKTQEAS